MFSSCGDEPFPKRNYQDFTDTRALLKKNTFHLLSVSYNRKVNERNTLFWGRGDKYEIYRGL